MNKRIVGYDLARALAVFGMVVVNFKVVMGAAAAGPAWLVRLVGLLDGRAAATFVVLAGVGLSLMSRRARVAGDAEGLARDRAALLKRALFLFVVGLAYTPIWPADILHFYGVYLAAGAFLLGAPSRRLWGLAVAAMLAFALLLLTLDYSRGWDWSTLTYAGFWTARGMLRHLFFNGFHPFLPWVAFLLVGMLLGRADLSLAATRRRVLGWGVAVAAVAEFTSALLLDTLTAGVSPEEGADLVAVFGTAPMPPMPLYILAGAGTACAVIAAAVAVSERKRDAAWLRPLVSTGQLALTLYVAHVVLGMGALEALGRLEHQSLPFAVTAAVLFSAGGVAFAHLWRGRFERGPLEAVLRRLTGG